MKQIIEKHPVLACFLVALLAYLPITSFLFAVKNDFFAAYFPLKFFLSESLDAGSFPLWNPYLNYGFPTYGDMSLGYWNPGTWFIASIPGYNAYTFTLEMLAYLLLAVWGMYHFSSLWLTDTRIKQLVAVSYACSGFIVGHLQHFNWITGAACVPICLFFLISYLRSGALNELIASTVSCFWLLSSAHPGISIGFMIYSIPLIAHLNLYSKKQLARLGVMILSTLLLSSGMIYGYGEVLPYTNRSNPIGDQVMTQNATTVASWISFLFSLPVTKNDEFFRNDISMRNCFMGILLFGSLIVIILNKMRGSALYFLVTGFIFLILASELVLPFYKHLPLVNYVRLNSEFRVFALLSFIVGGSLALQEALKQKDDVLRTVLRAICICLGLSVVLALGYGLLRGDLYLLNLSVHKGNPRQAIKAFLAGLTMADTIIIQGSIQIALGLLMIRYLKAENMKKLFQLGMLEIIFATLLQLPFTGVGQLSPRKINEMVGHSPHGIPPPSLFPEHELTSRYPDTKKIIGSWELYSKEIALDSLFPYPLVFRSTLDYFDSGIQKALNTKPAFFFSQDSTALIPGNIRYYPNSIEVAALTSANDTFVVKQNNYKRWSAWVQGQRIPIVVKYSTLIGVPVPPGRQTIKIEFRNDAIILMLIGELIAVLLLLVAYAWITMKKDHRIRYIFP